MGHEEDYDEIRISTAVMAGTYLEGSNDGLQHATANGCASGDERGT